MKVVIVSDTHGMHRTFEDVIEIENDLDLLLHLGDVEGGAVFMEEVAGCECHFVSGNNDFFDDLPEEETVEVAGKKIWMTHGHTYYVGFGLDEILEAGKEKGADIILFGHIHRPVWEEIDGITILNPGSLTYPRQMGRRPTYIVMTASDKEDITYEFKEL